MESLIFEIKKIFKDAIKSFYRFPASITSAIIISIIGIIRISMGWEAQKPYDFLFDSIQISALLGAISSMALVVLDEIRDKKDKQSFLLANISGLILGGISFILIYFFGGNIGEDGLKYITSISSARMGALIFTSIVLFIYFISKSKTVKRFSDSFFISHRAFIISAIYGLVIMIGVSGVLGAFQSLVYRDMSYKVYQYLGVMVGFMTYTIFLGYFPSFRGPGDREKIEEIKTQPRFIYVLFSYILVPIMTGLTLVLLIWSVRVILNGIDVSFNQLSSIASSYVIVGIWLHIMVSQHENKMANFYKKAYPFSAILVLIFEAWALVVQLGKFGLKTGEYSFLMIWIFASISILLLILQKDRAYRKISITAIIISIVWVLPIIGYADITFNSQINRLEEILIEEALLQDGEIKRAEGEVEREKRGQITDAVDFISNSEKKNTPNWFKKDLNKDKVFRDTFGFEKTYGIYLEPTDYSSVNLNLETGLIDIKEYDLSFIIGPNRKEGNSAEFEINDKKYEINWSEISQEQDIPKIEIKFGDKEIIKEDLKEYFEKLLEKYPPEANRSINAPIEDLSLSIEAEDIEILLVFESINIYSDRREDRMDYYTNLQGIYIRSISIE